MLEQHMALTEESQELKAKYLLLLAVATGDISYAETIFSVARSNETMIRLACKFLTKYYIKLGDCQAVMKYALINDSLVLNSNDIIHEEDL